MYFSSMTPDEFISLNRESIPAGMVQYFDLLQEQIASLQKEVEFLRKDNELTYEQQCFGVELVTAIQNEVRDSSSKLAKAIRAAIADSSFET